MKLNTFNPQTMPNMRSASQTPALKLYIKSGVILLNKTAGKFFDLDAGNQLVIHQDEEIPQNWYIEFVKKDGFTLRCKSGEKAPLCFNNTTLLRQMIDTIEISEDARSLSIEIELTPVKFEKGRELYLFEMTNADIKYYTKSTEE